METFATFVFAAVLIEAIVNIVQNIEQHNTSWQYWAALALGLVVGVVVAVNWNLDLFKMVGLPEGLNPYVGPILTGIIFSRGANFVSDLVSLVRR